MARIKLDPNVPIPESKRVLAGFRKYPFLQMQVGESFFLPIPKGRSLAMLRNNVCSAADRAVFDFRQLGVEAKFSTRKVEENGQVGVRCWRIQ